MRRLLLNGASVLPLMRAAGVTIIARWATS